MVLARFGRRWYPRGGHVLALLPTVVALHRTTALPLVMSRRPPEEETFYHDAQEGEFEDAEGGVSGVGEGDEVMQEAQGEEEYSEFASPTSHSLYLSSVLYN